MNNINYDQEIEKRLRPENFEENNCEKCGQETGVKLVGDESYDYCEDCNWVTY